MAEKYCFTVGDDGKKSLDMLDTFMPLISRQAGK
jgi:hypothetical protein